MSIYLFMLLSVFRVSMCVRMRVSMCVGMRVSMCVCMRVSMCVYAWPTCNNESDTQNNSGIHKGTSHASTQQPPSMKSRVN